VLAHGKANRTKQSRRTATLPRTTKACPHGNVDPHDRGLHAWQTTARTATFAVRNVHAHVNVCFAVGCFAGQTLPCVHARQSLCRALFSRSVGCIYNSKNIQLKSSYTDREMKMINSIVNSASFR
jgi:hypothetical protein